MLNAQQLFEKMKFLPVQELEQFDMAKAPLAEQVKAFAESSEHVRFLAYDVINPLLEGALATGASDKETAITGCYYRAYAWMGTLSILREPIHFQAVAVGARSLFEIWVDMKLLMEDSTGKSVEQFHAFPKAERFRAAKKIVEFSDKNPTLEVECAYQRTLVSNSSKEQEVEALVVRLWGRNKEGEPNYPRHWSGRDLTARIPPGDAETKRIYSEHYPRLSWYVHSGSAGYAGLDEGALRSCFALSHIMAQRASLNAIELVAKEMRIMQAVDWLPDAIEKTRMVPGLLVLQGKLSN